MGQGEFDIGEAQLCGQTVSIEKIGLHHARDLAVILAEDKVLRQPLGGGREGEPTPEGVLESFVQWCRETHSISFAITDRTGACVGTISLSHIDAQDGSAGIGYWITSSGWGQGVCSEAFDLVLSLARKLGLTEVYARIDIGNVASRRIWIRQGAKEELLSEDRARYTILLDVSFDLSRERNA